MRNKNIFLIYLLAAACLSGLVGCGAQPDTKAIQTSPHDGTSNGTNSTNPATPLASSALALGTSLRGDVLVVGPQAYLDALPVWVKWKRAQGFQVILHPTPALAQAQDILDAVHRTFDAQLAKATNDRPAGFVMLVGDCASGTPENVAANRVPCGKRSSPFLGDIASDFGYSLPDTNGQPRLAVGRWPVASVDEARMLAERSARLERQAPSAKSTLRNRLHFIAGAPGYSAEADQLIERYAFDIITKVLPLEWDLRVLYTSPTSEYATGALASDRAEAIGLLEAGAFATVICSHGSINVISGRKFERLLENVHMADLGGDASATHLFIFTCSSGNFANAPTRSEKTGAMVSNPGPVDQRSLAEVTLLNPHGPPLVVASSSISHPLFNKYLVDLLIGAVLKQNPADWGTAWYRVQRQFVGYRDPGMEAVLKNIEPTGDLTGASADHAAMYNYLGDPTLEFTPLERDFPLQVRRMADAGGDSGAVAVYGRLAEALEGSAEIEVIVHRDEIAKKRPKTAADGTAAEKQAAGILRYRLTANKTIAAATAGIHQGEFSQVFRLAGTDWLRAQQVRVLVRLKNGKTMAGVADLPEFSTDAPADPTAAPRAIEPPPQGAPKP